MREYIVQGRDREYRLQLTAADAKRLGAKLVDPKPVESKKVAPANKARTAGNK